VTVLRTRYVEATEWLAPTNIDNTGATNVSKGLTNWLADTGGPGDLFRLRPGSYWVPQGIRIGKALRLDLNGATLFTGTVLGDTDTSLAANTILYPPLWEDFAESATWPLKRCVVVIAASNVTVYSSVATARVQGGCRLVHFRGAPPGFSNLNAGVVFDAAFEGQHAFRLEAVSDVTIDLSQISAEFVGGDGVDFRDDCLRPTVRGVRLGEAFMSGNISTTDDGYLEGYTGQGGTISGTPTDPPTAVWVPDGTGYPGIHHTGRQGVATERCIGMHLDGFGIWRVGRSAIDFEPAGAGDAVDSTLIENLEVGIHTLNFFSGAGEHAISNLTIRDCVSYERILIDSRNGSAIDRHSNWLIENVRCLTGVEHKSGSCFEVSRIDGLDILNNFNLCSGAGDGVDIGTGTGPSGASTDVTISPVADVQFPHGGGARLARATGTAGQATVTH
jgi:hypothetical protein